MKFNINAANIYELKSNSQRLSPMEGVRGFAVLLVFFVHCFGLLLARRLNANIEDLPFAATSGFNMLFMWLFKSHHGVFLFFILSGFLICRILQKPDFRYLDFMLKRVIRIYPAFLFSLTACILAGVYILHDTTFDTMVLVKNLFFLNGLSILGVPGYNKVTWSLFNEFVFYLVFPLAFIIFGARFLGEKWRIPALGIAVVYGPFIVGYVDATFLFFFAGAFIALFKDEDMRQFCKRIPTHFVVGCYLFATMAWLYRIVDFGTYVLYFMVGGTLLFMKACYGEGVLPRVFTMKPLRYLGNISYSFYLIHALIIDLVFAWLNGRFDILTVGPGMLVFIALSFCASWAAGTLMFVMLEKPYFSHVRTQHVFAPSAT